MADVNLKKMDEKTYTTVNFETAYELTDEWTKTVGEFEGAVTKAADDPTFKVLENPLGFSNGFPTKFDQAIEELINNAKDAIKKANDYFDELKKTDEDIEGLIPKKKKKKNSNPEGTGRRRDRDRDTEPATEKPTVPETEPATEPLPDNSAEQIAKFRTMSMSDLTEVLATLNTLAKANGKTLDELIGADAFKDQIKEALLKNVNISQEIRTLIEAGSSDALIIALKKLINGEIPEVWGIDQDTTEVLKTYLTDIASKNETTLSDLISKEAYKSVVKDSLAALKVVKDTTTKFTETNVQAKMLDIYDGADTEIDDLSMDVIREQIDVISDLTDITYNELLLENAYAGEMLKSAERLTKAVTYAETLSTCSSTQITSVLTALFK